MPAAQYGNPYSGESECFTCGATVPYNRQTQHNNFHLTYSNRKNQDANMRVDWCDYGDHPFKADEEGSASFSGTEVKEGKTFNTTMAACSRHNPANLFREAKRLEIQPDVYQDLQPE